MRRTAKPQDSRLPRRTAGGLGSVLAAALAVLAILPAGSQPASAQAAQCGARAAIIERLSVKYEEAPVSLGITATGSLLEVLASPSGSWTIIVSVPNGPTCLVSSGEGWRAAPVQLVEDPAV